jgi:hypothetical protein
VERRLDELIIPPALRQAHREGLSRFFSTGKSRVVGRRIEITAMRADGTEFPIELSLNTVVHDGSSFMNLYK